MSQAAHHDDDDDEKVVRRRQELAFQEFMLRGKKKKKKSSEVNHNDSHHPVVPPVSQTPLRSSSSSSSKHNLKRLYAALKSFRATLVRDWLDVDEQLHRVWDSVANLRERCRATSRCSMEDDFASCAKNDGSSSLQQSHSSFTCSSGYRPKAGGLNRQDLQLAQSYNLRQHERMLGVARNLLLKLGQAQEALGRRLDQVCWLYYHYQMSQLNNNGSKEEDQDSRSNTTTLYYYGQIQECEELFKATARELFRKQRLADQVLGSVQDALLLLTTTTLEVDDENVDDPVACARRCARQWSHSSSKSHLGRFENLLVIWRRECARQN